MITTKANIDLLEGAYGDIDLTLGGIYVGRDGRELSEMKFNFSPDVKGLLEQHLAKETLNSFDVNLCLEHLSHAVMSEEPARVKTALQGVQEIFEHIHAKLCELPDHPRLFRFGEVFQSKQSMALVLQAAPDEAKRSEPGHSLIQNLRYSYDWSSDYQPADLTDEQVQEWFDQLNHSCKEARRDRASAADEISDDKQTYKELWRPPAISRDQVELSFEWVEAWALHCIDSQVLGESMAFLCHMTQQVSSKLAMMTGDGYESIPGTRLFSDPEKEKAISRVEIEHALLTSSLDELLETAKVGAVMVAVGGSALNGGQLAEACGLGASDRVVDANSYGMTLERQMQSGLRVLRLIHQLSTADPSLSDVLQLYGRDRLSIPWGYADLGASCARVWELRDLLDLQVWEPRPEEYRELQSHLVRIISNGRASLGPSNKIQRDDVPR